MIIGIDGNEANVKQRVGSNQYAFELLHALHDLPEAKRHEWVIYLRESPLSDLPCETERWRYKVFGPKRFWTQFALPLSLLVGKRPEVFFTPGHYRPRWSPVPTVVSIMDLGYLRYPEQFIRKDLIQLTNWTARSIKKSNHIIAISESTKRDIMKYYHIPENKITVTYPGYDKKNLKSQISNLKIEELKKKYGIVGDYILFLGTLKPSKNIEGLLEAFKDITYHISHIILVIAGKKGWLYESIFQKVKELELEDKVIFTDFVPDEDVPSLLAGAKVFVLSSFWEGFGIPVLEAMAMGTPVVASNVGSLSEVVGEAGILADQRESKDIARGIQEAWGKSKELRERGLKQVKKFSWENCARQTLEILEKVAKPHEV